MTVAQKILEAGHPLAVFDNTPRARANVRAIGAEIVGSPREVAHNANIIILFLPGPEQVEACVGGEDGLLQAAHEGLVIADMSTVDPGTSQRMAQLALQHKVGYLDAPVLGRPATVGHWALPVGGDREVLEQCRPVFELFAAKIFHIGEAGSGNKVKLLNQLMFSAINAMTAEMMAVAEQVGIEPKLLYQTITESQAGTVSNLFKELGARIAAEDYDNPTFSIDLLCKDLRLAVGMARQAGAAPLMAYSVQFLNELAQARGLGRQDTAIMWKAVKMIWD